MAKGNDVNWKPIDTIPKNGKMVLTWGDGNYVIGNQPPNCGLGKWTKYDTASWCGSSFSFHYKPTHWMELPEPPK